MTASIAAAADKADVVIDEQTHNDSGDTAITADSAKFLDNLLPDSFQRIFWQQQVEVAAQKDPCTMHWHPLMICWCLYLRHRLVTFYLSVKHLSAMLHIYTDQVEV